MQLGCGVTGLYWAAAALALLAASRTAVRLRRDRSVNVAVSVLCMAAMAGALILPAVTPALLQSRPSPPLAAWASSALGLLAAWTFPGTLGAVIGEDGRLAALVAVPALGVASTGALQLALERAVHGAPGAASSSGLPVAAAQLVLLTYYYPALARTTVLAWRYARCIPVRHIGLGMYAVATAAVAEFAVTAAKSCEIIATISGTRASEAETAGTAVTQGVAIIQIIAGATAWAWAPMLISTGRQCRTWTAWWRLRPLWAAVLQAALGVQLPAQPGTRFNARYRLHRRVIEIRDAELALRPWWDGQLVGQAADAARAAGLSPDRRYAILEAVMILTALDARLCGARCCSPGTLSIPPPGNDLESETARLLMVSRAMRHSPIVQRFSRRPGPRFFPGHPGRRPACSAMPPRGSRDGSDFES